MRGVRGKTQEARGKLLRATWQVGRNLVGGWRIGCIVKLSEFEQELGNTRIHNSLIVQNSGCWPEVENQPNLT